MAKEYAQSFYKSKAWEDCRDAFIRERISMDGGLCQICGQRLGYIVHHDEKITEANINDAGVTLSHENLVYVCLDCHNAIHRGDLNAGKGGRAMCVFSADGQPIDARKI